MDKQTQVIYSYNGIPLWNKKEHSTDMYNNADEALKCYAEWKKHKRTHIRWVHLYEGSEQRKPIYGGNKSEQWLPLRSGVEDELGTLGIFLEDNHVLYLDKC